MKSMLLHIAANTLAKAKGVIGHSAPSSSTLLYMIFLYNNKQVME